MIVEPNRAKKELLMKNGKEIMSMDDKIIIEPFLFYSYSLNSDRQKIYNLFLKMYNNFDSTEIICSNDELIYSENIVKIGIDKQTGKNKYTDVATEFIEDIDSKIRYIISICPENKTTIFYKEGKYYYCMITNIIERGENESIVNYIISEVEGKPDLDLPKLTAYDENNHCIGTL